METASANVDAPIGHDKKILNIDALACVCSSAKYLNHRHWQRRLRAIRNVAPERLAPRGRCRVQRRHRHGDNRVGAKAPLVRGAVEIDEASIDESLIVDGQSLQSCRNLV